MDISSNRSYFPLSARIKIPAVSTVDSPYRATLQAQARNLEYIEITIPQTGVLQDLGVRITSNEGLLYPGMGSITDSNFASGKDAFGAMATSGNALTLPFNRKLYGSPYLITFEFYNDGAGSVAVNILAVLSEEKYSAVLPPDRKKEVVAGDL